MLVRHFHPARKVNVYDNFIRNLKQIKNKCKFNFSLLLLFLHQQALPALRYCQNYCVYR